MIMTTPRDDIAATINGLNVYAKHAMPCYPNDICSIAATQLAALSARVKELEVEREELSKRNHQIASIAVARLHRIADAQSRATRLQQDRDEAYERAREVTLLAIRQYKEQQEYAHSDGDECAGYKESGSFFSTDQNLASFVDAAIRQLAGPEKEG